MVKVTGSELLEALEASTYCTPEAIGGFPQVSGITYTVNTGASYATSELYPDSTYGKPDAINRVTILTVGGEAFDKDATYTIVTNDFLGAGGDTYYAFKASPIGYDLGVPLDEVVMDYITSQLNDTVTADQYGQSAGRITITEKSISNDADSSYSHSSSGSTTNSIAVTQPANCVLSVSSSSAAKGTTISVTATPEDGYQIDKVTVTDKNGNAVTVSEKEGKYIFTMPNGNVTVTAVVSAIPADSTPNPTTNFIDVDSNAYYADAVDWAVEKGITNGTGTNTFEPNASCTRAQVVTFLWRAAGEPAAASVSSFNDVASNAYYADAVSWAVEKGITNGTSADAFSPNATCTRGQIVSFLARYAEGKASSAEVPFADVDSSDYYADAVAWAVENDITNGTTPNTFSPNASCTRGQVVTLLYRAIAE
jgi:hypothetical protein